MTCCNLVSSRQAFSGKYVRVPDQMAKTSPPRRATPPLLKDLNERTVLESIRAGAPVSRAEISRRVGISKPTVSLALQSLLDAGLVRETEHEPGGPSYGAVYFEPVPDAALVLGLDLGARFLRGAICDLTGEIRARQDVELPQPLTDTALDLASSLLRTLTEAEGLDAGLVDGAVVGVPGVVEAQTGRVRVTHFSDLDGRAFGAELEERLDLPVTVENDINLAAVGEHWLGVARGVDDFAFLSVGTGPAPASSCAASSIAAITARPERSTTRSSGSARWSTRLRPACPSWPPSWPPSSLLPR